MNPSPVLVDTDILSAVMRKHAGVTERARSYLELHRNFTFSIITQYEILRGLFARGPARSTLLAGNEKCPPF